MLQNAIAGMQGIIDHAMVGHFVGYTANAAIGVSWQIIIVVIVFISSLFTGMAVLVARFAGANEPEKVNRVVYQAFLTAVALSVLLAAIGYFAAPTLLNSVNAAHGSGRIPGVGFPGCSTTARPTSSRWCR
jgi:Na+-driven multidrug efflux pump